MAEQAVPKYNKGMTPRFTIEARRWYSWQMFPGYLGRFVPYCSPIYVFEAAPLKTGRHLLRLHFFNAGYAEGVQDFVTHLRVLKRASTYLFADLVHSGRSEPDRSAVVGTIEFDWLRHCLTEVYRRCPPRRDEALDRYLERLTGFSPSRLTLNE